MAYYLTIRKGKNYKLLDVTSLDRFERLSAFKNSGMSLYEVDKFTTKFKDENDLKTYLCQNEALEVEDFAREISIRRKNKDKLEKVRYDIAYMEDTKYFDYSYLRNRIVSLQNDNIFIDKLLSYYRNSYCNNSMIYLINSIMIGMNDSSIDIGTVLDEFVKKELFDTNIINGEARLKYKSLHDLAMFVRNYDQKYLSKKHLDDKDNIENKDKIKVKKRVKKNEPMEGQYSLFDE